MGRKYPKIPLRKRPREVRTWQAGSFTTASLGIGGLEDNTITHGLGADDVMVIIMAKGNSNPEDWLASIVRPDGTNRSEFGGEPSDPSFTLPSAPSSGDITIRVTNGGKGTQTVTINYLIIRSDEVVD